MELTSTEKTTPGYELIPRDTIETIVGHRDEALRLYGIAFERIADGDSAIKKAAAVAALAHPGRNGYNYHSERETDAFKKAVQLPDRDEYMRIAERLLDINVWSWVIERTNLELLMDKEAKDKLHEELQFSSDKMPPVTVANIYDTLKRFTMDAGLIFRRGIANAFSSLDRRFKSHDGFKVGSRVVLTRVFDDWGSWSWHSRTRDTLIDIERAFCVLDGKDLPPNYASAIGAIELSRRGAYAPRQSECETEYFLVRGFKNGNAHLWFRRDDLLEKVNKLLAEYYGEVIADDRTTEADPFEEVKTAPARYYGFYPTPEAAAKRVIEEASLWRDSDDSPMLILEPSAGTGNLARRCMQKKSEYRGVTGGIVDCIEIQPDLALQLQGEGIYNRVVSGDFLSIQPSAERLYDRVIMNPPFDRERDIDHVVHAMKFVKPGGRLTAIMSAGTEFRQTRKAIAFRELMEKHKAKWIDLPAGSFSEVGTYVNTLIIVANL